MNIEDPPQESVSTISPDDAGSNGQTRASTNPPPSNKPGGTQQTAGGTGEPEAPEQTGTETGPRGPTIEELVNDLYQERVARIASDNQVARVTAEVKRLNDQLGDLSREHKAYRDVIQELRAQVQAFGVQRRAEESRVQREESRPGDRRSRERGRRRQSPEAARGQGEHRETNDVDNLPRHFSREVLSTNLLLEAARNRQRLAAERAEADRRASEVARSATQEIYNQHVIDQVTGYLRNKDSLNIRIVFGNPDRVDISQEESAQRQVQRNSFVTIMEECGRESLRSNQLLDIECAFRVFLDLTGPGVNMTAPANLLTVENITRRYSAYVKEYRAENDGVHVNYRRDGFIKETKDKFKKWGEAHWQYTKDFEGKYPPRPTVRDLRDIFRDDYVLNPRQMARNWADFRRDNGYSVTAPDSDVQAYVASQVRLLGFVKLLDHVRLRRDQSGNDRLG